MLMGNLHEVSRKVSAWTRQLDASLWKKLRLTPILSLTPLSLSPD